MEGRENTTEPEHTASEASSSTSRQCHRQISDTQVKDNIQKQLDELLVVQSIFDETILTIDSENRCGRFVAYPNITESPFYITFCKSDKNKLPETNEVTDDDSSNDVQKIEIKYLPRIEFTFALDDFYPSEDPPAFLISCQWLSSSQMSRICEHLDALYSECQCEILYSWFTFLRDDVLSFLDVDKELDIGWLLYNSSETIANKIVNYIPQKSKGNDKFDNRVVLNDSTPNILRILTDFEEFKREELFANEWFCCNICFSRKQGRDCVMFNCNHTNCTDCVKEYLKMQIVEGAVQTLKCPQHKCNAMITPAMVQKIVGDELFRRYDELLLASALNTMHDIVYCPRKSCQSPVVPEADSDLAVCPACNFAFCKFCNYTYHGVQPCRLFKNEVELKELLNQYNNGTDSEKDELEKRYGKERLRRELDALLSHTWIENFSKSCPKCSTKIEKIDGCNKMFCNRCQSSFCWICLDMLSAADPYSHFRRVSSKCFNKLFAGMMVDNNLNYNVEEEEDDDEADEDDIDDDLVQFGFVPVRF